jgi:hypothetical protein
MHNKIFGKLISFVDFSIGPSTASGQNFCLKITRNIYSKFVEQEDWAFFNRFSFSGKRNKVLSDKFFLLLGWAGRSDAVSIDCWVIHDAKSARRLSCKTFIIKRIRGSFNFCVNYVNSNFCRTTCRIFYPLKWVHSVRFQSLSYCQVKRFQIL